MSTSPKSHKLELEAMRAKHAADLAKLQEKHALYQKAKFAGPKKSMRRNQGR